MQQVLRTLNHCRAIRLFGDVDQAFDPPQIGSEILLQRVEEKSQCLARNRLVAGKAERGDVAVVQVMMIVCVIIIVVMMMMRVGLLVGGGIEPGARVAGLRRRERAPRRVRWRRPPPYPPPLADGPVGEIVDAAKFSLPD